MATAAAITDKRARAEELRKDAFALTELLADAEKKLEAARRTLGTAESKRQKLTEAAAAGHAPKPSEVAAIDSEISTARISFDGVTALVNGKRAALENLRSHQESLGREIATEEQREARRARFDLLTTQGTEAANRVSEKLRMLIEEDLPALDRAIDSLLAEFVGGQLSTALNPEASAARAVINKLKGQFFDGSFLAASRRLLRAGWTERGDIVLEIKNLRPPAR